jgi:hypothetical protein
MNTILILPKVITVNEMGRLLKRKVRRKEYKEISIS